jgi:hypothetical protein
LREGVVELRRAAVAAVCLSVLFGCGGKSQVAADVAQTFDENPDDVAQVCSNIAKGVSSRSDMEGKLDELTVDERADLVDSIRSSAGDGIPEATSDYGWKQTREFMVAAYDECGHPPNRNAGAEGYRALRLPSAVRALMVGAEGLEPPTPSL